MNNQEKLNDILRLNVNLIKMLCYIDDNSISTYSSVKVGSGSFTVVSSPMIYRLTMEQT